MITDLHLTKCVSYYRLCNVYLNPWPDIFDWLSVVYRPCNTHLPAADISYSVACRYACYKNRYHCGTFSWCSLSFQKSSFSSSYVGYMRQNNLSILYHNRIYAHHYARKAKSAQVGVCIINVFNSIWKKWQWPKQHFNAYYID